MSSCNPGGEIYKKVFAAKNNWSDLARLTLLDTIQKVTDGSETIPGIEDCGNFGVTDFKLSGNVVKKDEDRTLRVDLFAEYEKVGGWTEKRGLWHFEGKFVGPEDLPSEVEEAVTVFANQDTGDDGSLEGVDDNERILAVRVWEFSDDEV